MGDESGEGHSSDEEMDVKTGVLLRGGDGSVSVCSGSGEGAGETKEDGEGQGGARGFVYDRSFEELQCCLLMHDLGCLPQQDVLSICCDIIEARPPRMKVVQRPQSSSQTVFESGYSDEHLLSWRHLARLDVI